MIKLGKYQTLLVSRVVDFGVYLHADGDAKEVLLPARYVPENLLRFSYTMIPRTALWQQPKNHMLPSASSLFWK